jgi:glycosyltransferase involved in cell wall biosynthesis
MTQAPSSPRVSVLMPVYNGEAYLHPAVQSILDQSEPDFEFLIVDDGSTDQSRAILEEYAAKNPCIRILFRDHDGLVPALNYGISQARAPFIARMDADDIALPDRLIKQADMMEANPQIGVLGTHVQAIDADGRPLRTFIPPVDHAALDAYHIERGTPRMWHPSTMIRRDLLEALGGYSAEYPYCEDLDLWLRVAERTELAHLPEVLLQYRLHTGSVSVTKADEQMRSSRRAMDAAFARRGLHGDTPTPFDGSPPTELEVMRKWTQWARRFGYPATARHYAWKSFRNAPFAPGAVRLLVAALLGRKIKPKR